jgi:hypothetical protein
MKNERTKYRFDVKVDGVSNSGGLKKRINKK